MDQKKLAKWIKVILVGIALCGLFIYLYVVPELGRTMLAKYPEYAHGFWPWLIFIWCTGINCYVALGFAWKIAGDIGIDKSFSQKNAERLRAISILAATDAGVFFFGNVVLWLLNLSHPGIVILSMFIVFAGVSVSVAAAALSHLVQKAAALQEDSDLTI
ncbi:MAG: DUF2975 domain-containing protein [Lachnospiraceae bacterium]|nr:DUF2975 domain-containing protein [Lachnospiraceae bacterium]